MKKFKVSGYLLNYSEGTYSGRWEKTYLFHTIPNLKDMQDEIAQAHKESQGNYRGNMDDKICEIIAKHGRVDVEYIAYVWTDDYGTDDTSFRDLVNNTEIRWERK